MPEALPIVVGLAVLLLITVIVLLVILLRHGRNRQPDSSLQLLQQQISHLSDQQGVRLDKIGEQLSGSIQHMTTNLNDRLHQSQVLTQEVQKAVTERLESAGKTIGDVKGQLGQLSQATQNILQVGSEVRKLQDILQSPKLRGGLGEWSLENLLAEVLPAQHYHLQYTFKTGNKVDALVNLAQGSVSIDAKFPLPNFMAMLEAGEEAARLKWRKAFLKDVCRRIDEIADKYILPEEGTLDFALMYVPAENVYYETTVAPVGGEVDINVYARQRKVILVSPNTLYSYLMTIATGLKGLQIERNARLIYEQLAHLGSELELFVADYALVGKHLGNARAKYDEAGKRLDHFSLRLQNLDSDPAKSKENPNP
jgi:DNA recombination protein RmuC